MCHTSCIPESNTRLHPQFNDMTCFQRAHHQECHSLFHEVNRGGKTYTRLLVHHPKILTIGSLYNGDVPRRSERSRRGRPKRNNEIVTHLPSLAEVSEEKNVTIDQVSIITSPDHVSLSSPQQRKVSINIIRN